MSTEKKDPSILSINVAEDIKSTEVPPGTPKPSAKDKAEALPPEEVEKRQKIMLEYTRLQGRYCEPHNIPARWVRAVDIDKVMADGKDQLISFWQMLPGGAIAEATPGDFLGPAQGMPG